MSLTLRRAEQEVSRLEAVVERRVARAEAATEGFVAIKRETAALRSKRRLRLAQNRVTRLLLRESA